MTDNRIFKMAEEVKATFPTQALMLVDTTETELMIRRAFKVFEMIKALKETDPHTYEQLMGILNPYIQKIQIMDRELRVEKAPGQIEIGDVEGFMDRKPVEILSVIDSLREIYTKGCTEEMIFTGEILINKMIINGIRAGIYTGLEKLKAHAISKEGSFWNNLSMKLQTEIDITTSYGMGDRTERCFEGVPSVSTEITYIPYRSEGQEKTLGIFSELLEEDDELNIYRFIECANEESKKALYDLSLLLNAAEFEYDALVELGEYPEFTDRRVLELFIRIRFMYRKTKSLQERAEGLLPLSEFVKMEIFNHFSQIIDEQLSLRKVDHK